MAEQRAFTPYKGYRIYLPREGNFSIDAQQKFVVHVEIAENETGDHECMSIAGCIAGSYEQACKLSVEQAMLIIDSRTA